jgi:hypothetical protein
MTVTLDLPSQVEMAYIAAARSRGLPVEAVLREVLIAAQPARHLDEALFEQGLGLFGSLEDAALIDEVVSIAYEERRRGYSAWCKKAKAAEAFTPARPLDRQHAAGGLKLLYLINYL